MHLIFVWLTAILTFMVLAYVGFTVGDGLSRFMIQGYDCKEYIATMGEGDSQVIVKTMIDVDSLIPGAIIDPSSCTTDPGLLIRLMPMLPTIMDGLTAAGLIALMIIFLVPRLRR